MDSPNFTTGGKITEIYESADITLTVMVQSIEEFELVYKIFKKKTYGLRHELANRNFMREYWKEN